MPTYTYEAATKEGKKVEGARAAENEKALARSLKQEGLLLLASREKGKGRGLGSFNFDAGDLIGRLRGVKLVDKMFFSRNLAVMINAGLPLTKALEASAEETTNPKFKRVIADVISSIIQGKTFAESLAPHSRIFNELYVNMIEVGETSGKLSLVLKLLSNQMKKDHDLRSRVKGAMMYPSIVIIALIGVGAMMMIYVVPSLTTTLKELGVELPLSTRLIIIVSDSIVNYSYLVIAGLAGFIIAAWKVLKSSPGKTIFDKLILKAPVFGPLSQKFNLARFCRTLAYLIASGIPIVRALEITSRVLGNVHYRAAVQGASVDIQKGKQLNEILREYTHLFHPIVIQMIKVGEESGKISDMLLRLALFFEEDVSNTTKNLSSIIEPILMVVIGAIVGFFAVSMLQPIYGSLGNL